MPDKHRTPRAAILAVDIYLELCASPIAARPALIAPCTWSGPRTDLADLYLAQSLLAAGRDGNGPP